MTNLDLVWLILVSIFVGVIITFAAFCFALNYYLKPKKDLNLPDDALQMPNFEQFQLPQSLLQIINATDSPKKETCVALNLLFHFLYYELRNSEEVRLWFLKKLTLEFDELLTKTTTGKFIDKVTIKEIDLGSKFPIFNGISIQDVELHPIKKYIETLDLGVDLHYEGGFQLVTSVRLILGAPAIITVKVCHLSGRARLRFTRKPYSHWSFTFYSEPSLELQVDSHFQGRPIPQITSLIVSQIRKAVKKKHTIPQFKLRYKPFFQAPLQTSPSFYDNFDQSDATLIPTGVLKVSLIECTRLNPELVCGDIYCTLAVDEAPWTELVQTDSFAVMTLDLIVFRKPSQNLGVTFKAEQPNLVVVDIVERGTPGYFSKLKKGDILLAVEGTKVTTLSHASKLLKTTARRFTIRIERKRCLLSNADIQKTGEETADKIKSTHQSSPSGIRRRLTIPENEQIAPSETESSGSSTASPSNSPIKRSVIKIKNLQAPEETTPLITSRKLSSVAVQSQCGIQIYRTKELPMASDLNFNDSVTFQIGENIKYFNFGIWSTQVGSNDGKDILMGHLSIPLYKIIDKCTITGLGHLIKKWQLLEPCVTQKPHQLNGHSGFDPSFCFGDALFCFVLVQDSQSQGYIPSSTRASFSAKGDAEGLMEASLLNTPIGKDSPAHEPATPGGSVTCADDGTAHDFVRTHFSRTTQCDFCSKKIWLKDAVQCKSCKMTCHKKCVTKCQATAVCVPCDDDQSISQGTSPTKTPEIVTTEVEGEILGADITASPTPQSSKRGLGGLLASVANAAHNRNMKRAGSTSNLAPPDGTGSAPSTNNTTPSLSLSFSRSLPHSPQVSPSASRKASIADPALFDLPGGLAALDDTVDDILVEEAMEQLLQRSFDNEDIMSLAKDKGKELYCGQPGRKEKINKLISKLKVSMDREMQIQEALQAEAEDESEKVSRQFLLSKSEKRVQAITVLMLHCCSGLQHVQDTEV
ncbi:PDZ domain-containing protein 8 isoform X2 [Neocloeon triangulifer]|uniref:PDZ domain-containing protein 8 isoform X2 n=1 Tax=Neocloeon triangulifer TaxID=2078957 RepID=UPI00286EE164|nr:PDZ domain-containing protein 8 isoform X2 [Neocloeon triangulifer]